MVRRFPAVPAAVNWESVVVVAPRMIVLATPLVLVMFANVLLPVIVRCPAPPCSNVMLVYAMPPPTNWFAEALVILIVPVPVTVKFVDVLLFQLFEPAIVQMLLPDPKASVLTLELLVKTPLIELERVTLFPFELKVPETRFMADDVAPLVAKASTRVTDPPGVSM